MNIFNNKKNSVDSVGNSLNGPYLSPFFSSRDGRPTTILKNHDPTQLHFDMNSAINLLQYNNMVTVESMKNKKSKKILPLKDRITQKQSKRKSGNNTADKNDSSSAGNRKSEPKYTNNSFGPEAYFQPDLLQRHNINSQFFTEGTPSVNESHSKDYYQTRNKKVVGNK